jgi:RimJ/RimL family protein N-acetyltransferase
VTELRTPRLLLRRASWSDLEEVHAFLSDAPALTYWSHPPHTDLEQTREWLGSMIDPGPRASEDFLLVKDGRVIGKFGAWSLPEFGFLIRSEHWCQGLASEAMSAFLPHVFARPDVTSLTTDVDPRNAASLALLRRFGFVETGRATGTWHTHIGVCDSVYLGLERAAFLAWSRRGRSLGGDPADGIRAL